MGTKTMCFLFGHTWRRYCVWDTKDNEWVSWYVTCDRCGKQAGS